MFDCLEFCLFTGMDGMEFMPVAERLSLFLTIAGKLMLQLISGTQYLYWGRIVTFSRVEADGKGTLSLVFEVDGKEKYWSAFVHLNIKPISERTHRDVQLPRLNRNKKAVDPNSFSL